MSFLDELDPELKARAMQVLGIAPPGDLAGAQQRDNLNSTTSGLASNFNRAIDLMNNHEKAPLASAMPSMAEPSKELDYAKAIKDREDLARKQKHDERALLQQQLGLASKEKRDEVTAQQHRDELKALVGYRDRKLGQEGDQFGAGEEGKNTRAEEANKTKLEAARIGATNRVPATNERARMNDSRLLEKVKKDYTHLGAFNVNAKTLSSAVREYEAGKIDIPGVGVLDSRTAWFDPRAIQNRQATLNSVIDVVLEASGKQTNDKERAAILDSYGFSNNSTQEQWVQGVKRMMAREGAKLNQLKAGHDPGIIKLYEDQGGATKVDDGAGAGQVTQIAGDDDYNKLSPGALYQGPDKVTRRKP